MPEPSDRELLVRLDTKVEEMHRELITGNGGPSIKQRVSSLEDSRSSMRGWMAGASATAAALWGALEWFFHRGSR